MRSVRPAGGRQPRRRSSSTRRRLPHGALAAVVVWGALLFGAAGAVVAFGSRGGAEVFQYEQSRAPAEGAARSGAAGEVSAAHVAAVVAEAPEPVAALRRTRPARVSCMPGDEAVLRNPWSCAIVYRDGRRAHYEVTVEPDGHYVGRGTGIIDGCCVRTPALG